MFTPKLNMAQMRLRDLKDSGTPRLARAADRHNRIENSDRFRKLIELRHSAPGEETVRDLNLYCNRMLDYESCCAEAKKIIRLTYHQAGGLFDARSQLVEHAVLGGG